MADIKNVNLDGTLYNYKDEKARNDISDLKEDNTPLYNKGFVADQGYWAIASGSAADSPNWVRSHGYIPEDVVLTTQTISMLLQAYTTGDVYVGTWNGTAFSTSVSFAGVFYELNINDWMLKYQNYKFKITFYKDDNAFTPIDLYSDLAITTDVIQKLKFKSEITETTRNLFDGEYSGFTWMQLNNGIVENTYADSRTTFWCVVSFRNGNTVIASSTAEIISSTGRKSVVVTPNSSGDTIQIRHSGGTRDLYFYIPFAFTGGNAYAVSFDVDGYNPSIVGGLAISNIQIEKGNEATKYVPHFSAVDYVAREDISDIAEPSNNLFGGEYSSFYNMALSNGEIVNTATDNRTGFFFTIQLKNSSTNVDVSNTVPISFTGRVRMTMTASGNGDNIVILHNGYTRNLSFTIPFDFTSGKTYTISLDVKGFDVQTVGGLVLGNIQIEEGNENSPYIPIYSAVDYVARDYVNHCIPEKDLNVLLMGDSIFGNDGEIALFLDQICNSCVNGAFGGTRVSVRPGTSDAFRFFDGVNIITALCNQTWTDQDSAATTLSGQGYTWVPSRLAGLKTVDMSKIDLLIMDWGTNDYTASATISDITTAYDTVIDLLQQTYPKLRILVTTPIWRYWGTEADNENGDTKVYNVSTLKEIVAAIDTFMKDKRISVLNAYQNLPLSYKTASTYYDENDSTHLNTFGNKVYAELLHGKIRSIY